MKELQTLKSLSRHFDRIRLRRGLIGTAGYALLILLALVVPVEMFAQTRAGRDGGNGSHTSTATVTITSSTTMCNWFDLQEGTAPTLTIPKAYQRPRYVKCGRERIDREGDYYHVCWDRKLKKRSRFYVPVITIGPVWTTGWDEHK